MRAFKILQQALSPILAFVHAKRIETVFWAVRSLMYGGKLSLTALGRAARGSSFTKHSIKRVDRLLGNTKLHREMPLFYHAVARWLLRGNRRPVILIDWTRYEPTHAILAAAVPVDGRAMPIYSEAHPLCRLSFPSVHRDFLRRLRAILPMECRPIIVTDAGFLNPWFREVEGLGWDFVGRLRGRRMMRPAQSKGPWCYLKSLFDKALLHAQDFGTWSITPKNTFTARVVIGCRPKKKRTLVRGQNHQRKARERANEPWVLATSLSTESAEKICAIYKKRMQIEETFRDAKNHRFGWSFRHAMSRSPERIQVLLLLATLGMLVVTLIGQAAENTGVHLRYQANTIREHRVLSLFVLGLNLLHRHDDGTFSIAELESSARVIKGNITCLA